MQKPTVVVTAIRLLYLTLIIGVVRYPLDWSHLPKNPLMSPAGALTFMLLVIIFTFGLLLWLIYKMDRGRNWARITFLVMFILGVPLSIQPLIQSLSHSLLSGMLGLAQAALELVALIMLFSRQARPWFRPVSTPTLTVDPS